VHCNIICQRSKYFAAACEYNFQDAESGIISFEEDDSLTVEQMLLHLYSIDYSDSDGTTPNDYTSTASEDADFGPRWPIVVGSATKDPEIIEKAKIEKAKMLINIQIYALA